MAAILCRHCFNSFVAVCAEDFDTHLCTKPVQRFPGAFFCSKFFQYSVYCSLHDTVGVICLVQSSEKHVFP